MSVRTPARRRLGESPLISPRAGLPRLGGRASDSFLSQQARPRPAPLLSDSPSTPYHQFAAAQRARWQQQQQQRSAVASSPFATAADTSALSLDPHGSNTSSPAFRKGATLGHVSGIRTRASMGPGIVAVRLPGSGSSRHDDASSKAVAPQHDEAANAQKQRQRYIREKPLSQRLRQWPIDQANTLYLRYMVDFSPSVIIFDTSPTLPIVLGALLHLASLIACVLLNPGTPVTTGTMVRQANMAVAGAAQAAAAAGGRGSSKGSLFRTSSGSNSPRSHPPPSSPLGNLPEGAIPDLRSFARAQRHDYLRWTSALLTLLLLATASAITYKLFTTTRTYTFWMRTEHDTLRSKRARLVPLSLDEDVERPPWRERLKTWALDKLREVPLLGWFLGPAVVPPSAGETRLYSLDTWNPPTLLLRLFCIYSPLHAFLWALSSPLFPSSTTTAFTTAYLLSTTSSPSSNSGSASTSTSLLTRLLALLLWPALHAGIAAQLWTLSARFEEYAQDQAVVQGEVLREYDEKFVFPRAMPMMRDASTMTHQAETFDAAHEFGGLGPRGEGIVLPPSLRLNRRVGAGVGVGVGADDEDEDGEVGGDTSLGGQSYGYATPSRAAHLPRRSTPSSSSALTPNGAGKRPSLGTGARQSRPSGLRSALVDDVEDDDEEEEDDAAPDEEDQEEEEEGQESVLEEEAEESVELEGEGEKDEDDEEEEDDEEPALPTNKRANNVNIFQRGSGPSASASARARPSSSSARPRRR